VVLSERRSSGIRSGCRFSFHREGASALGRSGGVSQRAPAPRHCRVSVPAFAPSHRRRRANAPRRHVGRRASDRGGDQPAGAAADVRSRRVAAATRPGGLPAPDSRSHDGGHRCSHPRSSRDDELRALGGLPRRRRRACAACHRRRPGRDRGARPGRPSLHQRGPSTRGNRGRRRLGEVHRPRATGHGPAGRRPADPHHAARASPRPWQP